MNALVLLVEDDPVIREGAAFRLTHTGHRVRTAASLREAIHHLAQCQPDVVLLDIGLPDGDGFEMGHRLRAANIPFIFITARSTVRDRMRGLEIGADDYLAKPFGLDELVARVNALLRRVKQGRLSQAQADPT